MFTDPAYNTSTDSFNSSNEEKNGEAGNHQQVGQGNGNQPHSSAASENIKVTYYYIVKTQFFIYFECLKYVFRNSLKNNNFLKASTVNIKITLLD